jgi:hypothetical protein
MSLAAPNWEQEQIGRVSQLTVPAWLVVWGGLLVVAVGLRLGGLDAAPLAPDEAARALEARGIWRGRAEGYSSSPLLVNLLVLWGALFTFADGPARVPSVLAGLVLSFSPLLFSPWLGPSQRLLACGLLAVSPLGVLASRSVHPATLALLALVVAIAGVLRAYRSGDGRWLIATAAAAAVGLGATAAWVGQVMAAALAAALCPPLAESVPPRWRAWVPRTVTVGLATALLADTLLLTRPSGLQSGLIDPFPSWLGLVGLNQATALSAGLAWSHEVVLLALAGWSMPLALRDPFGRFLVAWSASSLALGLLHRASDLTGLAAPTLPLALLGGYGLSRLTWIGQAAQARIWLTAVAALIPIVFVLVATNMNVNSNRAPSFVHLAVAIGGVVAILLLASAWVEVKDLGAALGLAVAVGLVALGVTSLTRLNFGGHERGGPLLLGSSSRPEIREIELRARDWWRQDPRATVRVDRSLRPLLEWSLRDGPPVEWVAVAPSSPDRAILGGLTAAGRPAGQWQRLAIAERYLPPDERLSPTTLWRWIVMRQSFLKTEPHAILVQP